MRTMLFGALCAAALTACSPAPTPAPATSPLTSPITAQGPKTAPTAAGPTVPQVKRPWTAGSFQYGIQIYWHTLGNEGDLQVAAARTLDYAVNLGANSVGITFPIYTDGTHPTKVYAGKDTPSVQSLAIVVAAAKLRGLRVTLRPIIDEKNIAVINGAWRGTIQPVSIPRWFKSYDALLLSYAGIAQRYSVQELVAGTELSSLQAETAQWQSLTRQIQQVGYKGAVSYAYNWNDWTAVPFQTLGVDAYPKIQLGDTATVAQLTRAISAWLLQQPMSIRSRLTIQETGIPAQKGMYQHPYMWGVSGVAQNLTVQANWFSAMCMAAKSTKTQGIYYWMLDSNTDPSRIDIARQPSAGFVGRPAEQRLRQCFAS